MVLKSPQLIISIQLITENVEYALKSAVRPKAVNQIMHAPPLFQTNKDNVTISEADDIRNMTLTSGLPIQCARRRRSERVQCEAVMLLKTTPLSSIYIKLL